MLKMLNMLKIKILARENKTYLNLFYFRDRPFNLFNLQGGVNGFLFRSKHFFRTTRVRILIFFVAQGANFFFQNSTLGYMTKTLNQNITKEVFRKNRPNEKGEKRGQKMKQNIDQYNRDKPMRSRGVSSYQYIQPTHNRLQGVFSFEES